MRKPYLLAIFILVSVVGLADASYLTYQHYAKIIPPCPAYLPFFDCGAVLTSQYATIGSVPIALVGTIHYALLTLLAILALYFQKKTLLKLIFILTAVALLFSAYLVYLQLFVLEAICFYCTLSALVSLILFIVALVLCRSDRLITQDEKSKTTR